MSPITSQTPALKPNWSRFGFRALLITVALGLIVYFTIHVVFFVPSLNFVFSWDPDNVFKIEEVSPDSSSYPYLQPDDILATRRDYIDGRW